MKWLVAVCLVAASAMAQEVVVDFEAAVPLLTEAKANRLEKWEEQGVEFRLARAPLKSKGKGLVMFFTHLSNGHKAIVSAMATEPIPLRATFPKPVSRVALEMWGATGTPAVVTAYDADGKVLQEAKLAAVPSKKAAGDPVPIFKLEVSAPRIAYVEVSGAREGEYLAVDAVRFWP